MLYRLRSYAPYFFFLCVIHLSCTEPDPYTITRQDQPLDKLKGPIQTASFELRASYTGEVIATGISLRPVAQVNAPIVDEALVQSTDVLLTDTRLIASYNYKGNPHKGALQIIDVSDSENPVLQYEMIFNDRDLNRVRIYQDRYLIVASGDQVNAASLEFFDLEGEPTQIASLDLPSRQTTMVNLYDQYVFVTTGDDGGVVVIDLSDPTNPQQVGYYELDDARYVEVLSEEEILVVNGGDQASLRTMSWPMGDSEPTINHTLSLDGLRVGAPSWGFKVGDRFHLSADEQGLSTFSITDDGIEGTGIVPTEGDANAGTVSDDRRLAFLANGQEGLVVLDVQNGHPTQVLAQFDTPGDHGSANAVDMRGSVVALADGLGGVKILDAQLIRRGGKVATFLLNFADRGVSREWTENLIHDALTYTTPIISPRVLYVLDDFNNGEHSDDPPLTQSILEEMSVAMDYLDEPMNGLSPADLAGYDVVWFANPGWYVEDVASVDALVSFSAQGGGIVIQGDDMTHRRTQPTLLSELTGLRFVNNGTRTCGVRTNNQRGANYRVTIQDEYHPLVRSSVGESFLYGDDIDHSQPMGMGEQVLAWATLDQNDQCEVRTPVIVAWDPNRMIPVGGGDEIGADGL
jgi:hypothetical protein